MDIVSAYANFRSTATISQVQIAVAKKILDNQRMDGAAALKLLEAATSGTNKAGDALVAAATGLGSEIDVYG